MRTRFLGVVGALAVALGSLHCAAGSTVPSGGDSGTPPVDAAADVDEPPVDGPVQSDGPVQADGPAQTDGPAQADGPVQSDGPTQHDAGCTVQNTGACDPVCQNCGAQKCSINLSDTTKAACVDNGVVGVGEACTGSGTNVDNCQKGLLCLSSDAKCHQFCRADADCTALNGACILGITSTPFLACKTPDTCDPVANTGCTSPKGCFLWNNDSQTFCLTAGTGGDGVACPNGNECKGGFVCVGSGTYTCRAICRKTPPSGCPGAYTCQTLTGFTTYGFCAP